MIISETVDKQFVLQFPDRIYNQKNMETRFKLKLNGLRVRVFKFYHVCEIGE